MDSNYQRFEVINTSFHLKFNIFAWTNADKGRGLEIRKSICILWSTTKKN